MYRRKAYFLEYLIDIKEKNKIISKQKDRKERNKVHFSNKIPFTKKRKEIKKQNKTKQQQKQA